MTNTLVVKIILLLAFLQANAQHGYKHVNIDAGVNLGDAYSGSLSLELNNSSYSPFEIAIEVQRSQVGSVINDTARVADRFPNLSPDEIDGQWDNLDRSETYQEDLFLAGAYHKPLLAKRRNLLFNFRYGLLFGRAKNFAMGPGAGFELTYHFPKTFGIYLKQSNHYIINIPSRFRHSINLGIKIPL